MADALSPYDRDAVVRTVLGEAGDQGDEGQAAVANVIRNRHLSGGFGDTPGAVALQHNGKGVYQFEPWMHGDSAAYTAKPDSPAYQRAAAIVDNVYSGNGTDNTGGATHFFDPTLQADLKRPMPSWASTFKPTASIGAHNFYQDPQYANALPASGTSSGVVSDIARAISSPVQRASAMDSTNGTDQTSQYGNGPIAPIDNRELAKALITGAYSESKSPGIGTMLGKLAQLYSGMGMLNGYNQQQRDYINNNPALRPAGAPQMPQAPQAGAPQEPGILQKLAQTLSGVKPAQPQQPMPTQPIQAPTGPNPFNATPTPPVAPIAAERAPETPGAAPIQPPSGALPEKPALPPQTNGATSQLVVPPTKSVDQLHAQIEQQFPEQQIQYQLRSMDPAQRQKGMEMRQAKNTAFATAIGTETERPLTDGSGRVLIGNDYRGWRDSGMPAVPAATQAGDKAYGEEQGKVYGKKAEVIQHNAELSINELPQLRLLQKVMSSPGYTSGTGAGTVERLSSAARMMGLGTGETATLMQFADKLGKTGALENIQELGQQGAVRVPTLNLISKSNYSNENTPEANRAVVEIRARVAERQMETADLATDYAAKHGRIDPGFDKELRQHFANKPLFTADELQNWPKLFEGKSAAGTSGDPAAPKPAASQYNEGDIAHGPGGQTLVRKGGKWVTP